MSQHQRNFKYIDRFTRFNFFKISKAKLSAWAPTATSCASSHGFLVEIIQSLCTFQAEYLILYTFFLFF